MLRLYAVVRCRLNKGSREATDDNTVFRYFYIFNSHTTSGAEQAVASGAKRIAPEIQ